MYQNHQSVLKQRLYNMSRETQHTYIHMYTYQRQLHVRQISINVIIVVP